MAPPPPPRAPLSGGIPPVPPPAPKPERSDKSVFSGSSNSETSHHRHVRFASSTVNPSAVARISTPQNTTGQEAAAKGTHLPQVETNTSIGPGYIRVRGGLQTTRYHNYDGVIPTRDILQADSQQQANLINAMLAAQLGGATSPHGRHSTQTSTCKPRQRAISQIDQSRTPPALTQAPAAPPPPPPARPLTSANLEKASKASSTNSFTLTSVSRRHFPKTAPTATTQPPQQLHSGGQNRGTTALTTKSSNVPKLRCCNCGRSKKSGTANVKVTSAGVPLCWQCHIQFEGSEGVREWLART